MLSLTIMLALQSWRGILKALETGIDITEYFSYKWTKKRQCRNNNNGNQNKNQRVLDKALSFFIGWK